ncbi:hypothetical protein HY440_00505 [Candidatus Microgenomates bacterium]|nr:hypothetical protein [Candidatus Microgenomates bacterium]
MKRKLVIYLALFGLMAVSAAGIFWWYHRNAVLAKNVVAPFSSPDTVVSLSTQLGNVGIALEAPPTIVGDTITASISGAQVLFDASSSLDIQIRTLQLVLPRFKMETKKFTVVDLRFSKVVFR